MKHGTFYLLSPEIQQKNEIKYIEQLVCKLTSTQWRIGKSILITCENIYQAKKIDNVLWTFDKNSFLPHSLFKHTIHHDPITILWNQCIFNNKPKDLLINLMTKNMSFFLNFNEIIDFVPINKILKQLARNRYQNYKEYGFQLHVSNVSNL